MSSAGKYSMEVLKWDPIIRPVDADAASPAQLHALEASGKLATKSDYFRVLAHDPDSLLHRSVLYDHVMYSEGGLGRVERELAALVVSMQNGCRYCVSVHARRLGQLAKDKDGVQAILDGRPGLLQDPRLAMIAEISLKLTALPNEMSVADVRALRRSAGLDVIEYFDLINVIGMFGWANRLMQTLGNSRSAGVPVSSIAIDPGRTTPAPAAS